MGIAFGAEEAADFGGLHIFLYVVVVETYFNECDLNYKAVALLFDVVVSYKHGQALLATDYCRVVQDPSRTTVYVV